MHLFLIYLGCFGVLVLLFNLSAINTVEVIQDHDVYIRHVNHWYIKLILCSSEWKLKFTLFQLNSYGNVFRVKSEIRDVHRLALINKFLSQENTL
jgi:hypothetical protein